MYGQKKARKKGKKCEEKICEKKKKKKKERSRQEKKEARWDSPPVFCSCCIPLKGGKSKEK